MTTLPDVLEISLTNLVEAWRSQASLLMKEVRQGNYVDQTSRVIMSQKAKMARYCANGLAAWIRNNCDPVHLEGVIREGP